MNANFAPFSAGLAAPAPFVVGGAPPKTEGEEPEGGKPNALGVAAPPVAPNPAKPVGFAASLPFSCVVAGAGVANENGDDEAGLSVLGTPNAELEAGVAAAEKPGPENTDGVEAADGCPNGEGAAAEPLVAEEPNANPVFAAGA